MLGLQLVLGNVVCMLLADYRWHSLESVIHVALGREAARLFAQKEGKLPGTRRVFFMGNPIPNQFVHSYLISLFFPRLRNLSRDPLSNPSNTPIRH